MSAPRQQLACDLRACEEVDPQSWRGGAYDRRPLSVRLAAEAELERDNGRPDRAALLEEAKAALAGLNRPRCCSLHCATGSDATWEEAE
jgi:hypothetical protein